MYLIKQLITRHNSFASGLQLLSTRAITQTSVNRISVRTPQIIAQNYVKFNHFSRNKSNDITKRLKNLLPRVGSVAAVNQRDLHESITTTKKRIGLRKRRSEHHEKLTDSGYYNVMAFATAEEYDLEKLVVALKAQDLYEPKKFFNSDDSSENEPDVLFATAKYQVGKEPRGIYFFRKGTVVMWNFSDMESSNILGFLKAFEQVSYKT
jgi:uncharacterized Rmd1/YagE family protein